MKIVDICDNVEPFALEKVEKAYIAKKLQT